MEVNEETVRHIAKLARIKLDEKEVEQFKKDLSSILELFSKIENVETSDEFTIQPVESNNKLREDKVEESLSEEEIFKNTKHKEEEFFKGPKIK